MFYSFLRTFSKISTCSEQVLQVSGKSEIPESLSSPSCSNSSGLEKIYLKDIFSVSHDIGVSFLRSGARRSSSDQELAGREASSAPISREGHGGQSHSGEELNQSRERTVLVHHCSRLQNNYRNQNGLFLLAFVWETSGLGFGEKRALQCVYSSS